MYNNRKIIIFDGVCNLCSVGVRFVIKRDPDKEFYFCSMQGEAARKLIAENYGEGFDFESFLLIKDGVCYERSDGVLEVVRDLHGYWFLLRIFKIVPGSVRDFLYDLIAKNRYRFFGKKGHCLMPDQGIQDRFIES